MRSLVETKKDPTSSRWALCQSRDLPQTELLLIQWTQIRTAPWTVGPIHSVRHPIRRQKTRETDQYCHVRSSSSEIRLTLNDSSSSYLQKYFTPNDRWKIKRQIGSTALTTPKIFLTSEVYNTQVCSRTCIRWQTCSTPDVSR